MNFSSSDIPEYKEYFDFALESRCRLYMILSSNPGPILEGLYDADIRKGEFMTLWHGDFINSQLLNSSEPHFYKIKELIQGTILFTVKEWEGNLGKKLKRDLTSLHIYPNNMCSTYDSFSVIHNSIKNF